MQSVRVENLEAVRRVEADPNQDYIPLELVKRLLDDESPVKVWREHRKLDTGGFGRRHHRATGGSERKARLIHSGR